MFFCGIDFEATGVDTRTSRITEIGAVCLGQKASGKLERLCEYSTLVYEEDYEPLSEEVIAVTGITDDQLKAGGVDFVAMIRGLVMMFEPVGWPSYFVAHNKSYDEEIFKWEMKRHKEQLVIAFDDSILQKLFNLPWLCTIKDIEHPEKLKCKKLSHLALDYGVAVDPKKLHRAVADVHLMIDMLEASQVDLGNMIKRASVPDVIIMACIPPPFGKDNDGGIGKDKAKACGFGYGRAHGTDGPIIDKKWLKKVKEDQIQVEKEKLGYEVKIVEKA